MITNTIYLFELLDQTSLFKCFSKEKTLSAKNEFPVLEIIYVVYTLYFLLT